MDSSLGEVKWILDVDTRSGEAKLKKFRGDINETTGEAETSTGRMGGAWKTLGKTIAGAAIGAGVAITTAIIANIDDAVRRVDTLNNADRVFANMGFAASDTGEAIDDLEESIRGLPTTLDAAVRGVQILSGTIGDVGRSQEVFTALNNAIIGFGGSAFDVENAVRQIAELPMDGPLDIQTWNSLLNSGLTPVLTAMAKDAGVSIGEFRRQFSSGELSVQDFTDRLIEMNEKGGGGLVNLEAIARDATSGIATGFANMNTAVTRGIAEVIEAIGAENISRFISETGRSFENILKSIAAGITVAADVVQGLVERLQPLFDWIGQNEEAFEVLRLVSIGLAGVLLGTVVAAIVIIVGAFALLVGIIQFLADTVTNVIKFFVDLGNTISTVANDAWKAISDTFGNIGKWFSDRFGEASGGIEDVWSGIVDVITTVFNQIVSIYNATLKPVVDGIIYIVSALLTIWNTVWTTILTVLWTVVSTIVQILGVILYGTIRWLWENVLIPFGAFFASLWNGLVGIVTSAVNKISNVVRAVWGGIVAFLTPIVQGIVDFVSQRWNSLVENVRRAFELVRKYIVEPVSQSVNYVGQTIGRIADFIGNAVRNAYNTVREWMGRFFEAGKNIIDGLVRGVRSGSESVINTVKDIASNALEAVKDFFGISSPSKVMANQGEFLMQGLAKGIHDAGGEAVKAVNDVNAEIARQMTGGASSFDSDITGRMDASSSASGLVDGFNTRASDGAVVNQTNNFYQSDDPNMEKVNSDLTWQLGKL